MLPPAVRRFCASRRVGELAAALALASILVPLRTARASDEPESAWSLEALDRHLALDWNAPAECPSEQEVRERIRSLLHTPIGEAARQVHAHATVTKTRDGYRLVLSFEDGARRTLTSETCRGLVEGTSVILALDIQTRMGEATPPPAASDEPPAPRRSPPPPPKAEPTPSRSEHRSAIAVRSLLDVGSLPRATAGYRASVVVGYDAWSAEAAVTALVPRSASAPREGTGVEISLVTGGLRVCRSWQFASSVALATCAGSELGSSSVAGFGVTRPSTSAGLWASAIAASELRFLWNRALPLVVGVEIGAVLTRNQAVIQGPGAVFDPDPVLVRAVAGLEFEFFRDPRMK